MKRLNSLVMPLELVRSERGSLHCLQAAMRMAVHSLTGRAISWEDADRLSGYRQGFYTWPYGMLKTFAEMNLDCLSIEVCDPDSFASDPHREIRRLYSSRSVADEVIRLTDIENEQRRAQACVEDARIRFAVRPPIIDDIGSGIDAERLPLVSLDYARLHGSRDYEGHMVIVSGFSDTKVEIFDPGPPGDSGRLIERKALDDALHSPDPDSGAVILVWR